MHTSPVGHRADEPEWLHSHAHEPNPSPPHDDPTVALRLPGGERIFLAPEDLARLPQTTVPGCWIVSTGHGASGPFTFGGVRLADLIAAYTPAAWRYADIISADGYGNRVYATEAQTGEGKGGQAVGDAATARDRPILLATTLDGAPMTRAQGLVRLIVPSETEDALRQVKWVARIEVH
ncbi:MAG TPA: molybdopterin-dependent oxidoreductase [Caldilineaceae bacterium]|nr:molybdopterin-dependent oxidoreductase [Caldilineaceae bacterium]